MILLPTGILPAPATGTAAWWAWRPIWLVACLVAITIVLATVGVRATGRPGPHRPGSLASTIAVAGAVTGFVLVTTAGITASWGFLARAVCLAVAHLAARQRADWGVGGLALADGPAREPARRGARELVA